MHLFLLFTAKNICSLCLIAELELETNCDTKIFWTILHDSGHIYPYPPVFGLYLLYIYSYSIILFKFTVVVLKVSFKFLNNVNIIIRHRNKNSTWTLLKSGRPCTIKHHQMDHLGLQNLLFRYLLFINLALLQYDFMGRITVTNVETFGHYEYNLKVKSQSLHHSSS